jgi:hypothetical protein
VCFAQSSGLAAHEDHLLSAAAADAFGQAVLFPDFDYFFAASAAFRPLPLAPRPAA